MMFGFTLFSFHTHKYHVIVGDDKDEDDREKSKLRSALSSAIISEKPNVCYPVP